VNYSAKTVNLKGSVVPWVCVICKKTVGYLPMAPEALDCPFCDSKETVKSLLQRKETP
jgi:DNA-directed RNA polymerase subunit RPC12/RpoP